MLFGNKNNFLSSTKTKETVDRRNKSEALLERKLPIKLLSVLNPHFSDGTPLKLNFIIEAINYMENIVK